jgi:tRNA pseudouridine65 synthase
VFRSAVFLSKRVLQAYIPLFSNRLLVKTPLINIIHETKDYVVIDKPSGYLVHRSKIAPDSKGVVDFLRDQLGCDVSPAHRLDRQTSGVMIFSKNTATGRILGDCFLNNKVTKGYIALVRGVFPDSVKVERPLKSDKGVLQDSLTNFELKEQFEYCALVSAFPSTGRRHQIRRHLGGLSHQILGDTTHGKGRLNALYREKYGLNRMFLHASILKIDHPLFSDDLSWTCNLSPVLNNVVELLAAENLAIKS